MLLKFFLSLFILAALPGNLSGDINRPNNYEDYDDSTSFYNCQQFTHETQNGLHVAEVFGVRDTYDYVSYTAPYTRSVFFYFDVYDNCIILNGINLINNKTKKK